MSGTVKKSEELGLTADLKHLIKEMDITEETLSDAILHQAKLYLEASYYRVEKMKARMAAELEFGRIRTVVASAVRSNSEVKITEAYINEQVDGNRDVIIAHQAFDQARALEEFAKLVLASYDQRGSMCKSLVQLLGAEVAKESGFLRAEMDRLGIGKLRDKVESQFNQRR